MEIAKTTIEQQNMLTKWADAYGSKNFGITRTRSTMRITIPSEWI
jgi:hypothetical protein